MLPGVFEAKKKDGTIYYRSNLTFKNKHISLGSYDSEAAAHQAYRVASSILTDTASIEDSYYMTYALTFEKIVSLINLDTKVIYKLILLFKFKLVNNIINTRIMENTATEKVNLYSLLNVPKTATKADIVSLPFYNTIEKSISSISLSDSPR